MAFDVAVINPLGPSHWNSTLAKPAGAAEDHYSARKGRHMDPAATCFAAGIRYQPLVFERHGGTSSATAAVLHQIAALAAATIGKRPATIVDELFGKISVVLARSAFRSVQRRRRGLASRSVIAPLGMLLTFPFA